MIQRISLELKQADLTTQIEQPPFDGKHFWMAEEHDDIGTLQDDGQPLAIRVEFLTNQPIELTIAALRRMADQFEIVAMGC